MRHPLVRLATLCVVLSVASCGEDRLVVSEGQLTLEPRALDFKEVALGLSVVLPVKVKNPGPRAVTVTSVAIDTSAYSSSLRALTIAAGESTVALITFTPTQLGEATGSAAFRSGDGVVSLALRGVGVPRMTCRPCSSPPVSVCASSQTLVSYELSGVCIEGGCQFTANSETCSSTCDETTRACITRDAGSATPGAGGVDAGPGGGGSIVEAGTFDAGAFDAGPRGPFGFAEFFDAGEYSWIPPPGVTSAFFHGCGAGGAGGSVTGATGGGAACGEARLTTQPGRAVRVRVGRGGQQPGNGGGYTALHFTHSGSLEDFILGGGGGGGNGCGAACAGHWGGRGGAGGNERGQDGEIYFGSGAVCSAARGGLGGRELGGPVYGTGGLGGEVPSGAGGVRCAGAFGSRLMGGSSKTANGSVCNVSGGAFMWMEGGSEPGGGGAGGAGAFGGGGGGFVKDLCGGGGGGGASSFFGASAIIYAGDGQNPGFLSFGRPNAGRGGEAAIDAAALFHGNDGYVLIEW